MIMSTQRLVSAPCFALLLVAIGATGGIPVPAAWAQFEDVREAEGAARNQPQHGHFAFPEDQFDQWVYGRKASKKQHRERLDALVSLQLDRYDRMYQLSPKQKDLLRLAAQGDIKRLEDAVEIARKKFNVIRFDQQKFNEIWQDIQPLQTKINNGVFDESSLLHKITPRILDQEQLAKVEQAELERRKWIYQAKVSLAVTQLESSVPMLAEQRRQLEALLLEETDVPKKYGQYAYYVVMIHASKLPEEKLKAIFDDAQWRALKQSFRQFRGMERHLKQQGILP